jgi:hypothetical protein
MNPRAFIIGLCIVLLAQILIFDYYQKDNVTKLDQGIASLENRYRQLESEKASLAAKVVNLKAMVEKIPPWLLTGFEDPETGFVEFLDFLQAPEFRLVQSKVALGSQKFSTYPIPLHETGFTFTFSFRNTYEAEKFLDFLIFQEKFPLQVKGMNVKRGQVGMVEGTVMVDLMIPARLKLDQPATQAKTEVQ